MIHCYCWIGLSILLKKVAITELALQKKHPNKLAEELLFKVDETIWLNKEQRQIKFSSFQTITMSTRYTFIVTESV